jgi:hypothetical protein
MAEIYKEPSVTVYQQIVTQTPERKYPDFPAVIIGKLYQNYYRQDVGYYPDIQSVYPLPTPDGGEVVEASLEVNIQLSSGTLFLLDPAQYSLSGSDLTVVASIGKRGRILVTYKATRVDYKDRLISVSSSVVLENDWGTGNPDAPIQEDNPLLFGLKQALLGSASRIVYGINADEDYEGHVAALEILKRNKTVYFLVPMTQENWAHGLYNAHVEEMSSPDRKAERTAITSWNFELQPTLLTSTEGTVTAPNLIRLDDNDVDFIYEGIVSGDFIVIGSTEYEITTVSDHHVIVGDPMVAGVHIVYSVKSHVMSDDELAGYIREQSKSVTSRRQVRLFPDVYEQVVSGNTPKYVNNYFCAAYLAGFHSALPPSDSLSHEYVSFITDLKHSSNYFSETQLDTIASGGNTIIKQENPNSPAYIRRELTTDTSLLQTAEFSVTLQADMLAKALRLKLTPELGRKNKISQGDYQRVLFKLNIVATSVCNYLSSPQLKFIGPGTVVKWVRLDPERPDTALICVSLDAYYPLNNIDVFIFI